MKKLLLMLISAFAVSLNAQVYYEYFTHTDPQPDGTEGVALSPGDPIEVSDALDDVFYGWYLSAKDSNREVGPDGQASPLVSSEDALFYGDYKGDEMGQPVKLDSAVAYIVDQRSSFWVVNDRAGDTLRMPESGILYTSFLFKPMTNSKNSYRDFFGYEWSEDWNTSRGRVFMALKGDDVIFGISRNVTSPFVGLDTITIRNAVDQTFLMVMKYEMGDSEVEKDDTVRLYINPDPLLSEAEQTGILLTSFDPQKDRSVGNIVRLRIRQRGMNALIGGIRVGTDWTEVLQGSNVSGVSLDQETLEIEVGAEATLVARVSPDDARDPSVSWSSSDTDVATVADGVVTGVAEGTATITATTNDGGHTANCTVTIIPTSIFEASAGQFSVYPNPSTGTFTIDNSEGADLVIFNITGQVVFEKSSINSNELINTNLAKGMYLVKVSKDDSKRFTKLIIE